MSIILILIIVTVSRDLEELNVNIATLVGRENAVMISTIVGAAHVVRSMVDVMISRNDMRYTWYQKVLV